MSMSSSAQSYSRLIRIGFASWLGNISPHNSTLVDSLLQAGAVIHTRTGMAQGAWFSEGDNHVYGMTPNPYNILTVPGVCRAPPGLHEILMPDREARLAKAPLQRSRVAQ